MLSPVVLTFNLCRKRVFRAEEISKFFNGRQFFILTAVLFVVLLWIAPSSDVVLQGSSSGVCASSVPSFSMSPTLSRILSVLAMVGVSVLLTILNKGYSYVRDVTYSFSSTFLLLGIANPMVSTQFYDGTLLSVVLLLLASIMFGAYQDGAAQRKVYITFVLLAVCTMFHYSYVYLIPIMIFGFVQMRIMGLKSVLAMIFGLVTPYWIATGTGMISLSEYEAPHIVDIWSGLDFEQSTYIISVVALTILLSLVLFGMNVLKLISYKMQTRSYNGFFIALMLFTMIAMAVDYNNVLVYLPVLNICLSVQMAHAYTLKKQSRRFIPYLLFVIVCVASFVWQVFY